MSTSDSVKQWLVDLREETESECLSVLQGKSLLKESSDFLFVVPKSTKDHIVSIHQGWVLLKTEIKKLSRLVENEKWNSVRDTSAKVIRQVESQISNCKSSLQGNDLRLTRLQTTLLQECLLLTKSTNNDVRSQAPVKNSVTGLVVSLERNLQSLTDDTLCVLVKNVVDHCVRLFHFHEDNSAVTNGALVSGAKGVSNGTTPVSVAIRDSDRRLLIDSLYDIIMIGLQSNYMCSVLAKTGAVCVLLEMCRSNAVAFARCEVLRTLATICCVSESIEQFDQNGGVACLTDLLTNTSATEKERSEAAGVIAQMTSPSLASCQLHMSLLENIPRLIESLTGLCRDTKSSEIFLMSCAALANMAAIDNLCLDSFIECKTLDVLVESCTKGKAPTIFAKEQVAAVIRSIASHDGFHKDLPSGSALAKLLVGFLNERMHGEATALELTAYENVLQNTALAIDQLSHRLSSAVMFVKLQCLSRLVHLCQDPLLRNHNDTVLMNCLNALRRIFIVCGPTSELLKDEKEASKLVTSQLIDSYILCSSTDESFI